MYLMHPSILRACLREIIGPLLEILQLDISNVKIGLCKIVYCLIKVCGRKAVQKCMPFDAKYLLPVVNVTYLIKNSWYAKYVYYVWAAHLMLVPFPLTSIDPEFASSKGHIIELIQASRNLLQVSGKEREGSVLFLSSVFIRPDSDMFCLHFLDEFCDLDLENLKVWGIESILQICNSLLKKCSVKNLSMYMDQFFRIQNSFQSFKDINTNVRILFCKFLCRFSCFSISHPEILQLDIDQSINDLLLLCFDSFNSVRWAAAKQLAKLLSRLPASIFEEILNSICVGCNIEHFGSENEFHGLCLLISECIGFHHISDELFKKLVPFIQQSLTFSKTVGNRLVGSYVRDAACYVCWSIAKRSKRKYKDFELLIPNLICASLLDKEIQCRRAAAAALQECVGRLFPEYLKLIMIINFESVSDIEECFFSLMPVVFK